MSKESVAEQVQKHVATNPKKEDHTYEYGRTIGKDLFKKINATIEDYTSREFYKDQPILYIVVMVKKLKIVTNVIDFQIYVRLSCPDPVYKQMVFKYEKKSGETKMLWQIPPKNRCDDIIKRPKRYALENSWREQVQTVLAMDSGLLHKFVFIENGSKPNAVITEKIED